MNAEIDDHLDGEAAGGSATAGTAVLTETSKLGLRIPRDREGTFDPKLIAHYQRRFPGFDEKIVSMYVDRTQEPGRRGHSDRRRRKQNLKIDNS